MITITGEPKEIAALVAALQERHNKAGHMKSFTLEVLKSLDASPQFFESLKCKA